MAEMGVCLPSIDTKIDASPVDITAAADWLVKLQTGFSDAEDSLRSTAALRIYVSGNFGDALDEYIEDLSSGCGSADSELTTVIDVIRSWGDQVTWRKEDMVGYRDDASNGGLTVQDDRYINSPEPVLAPGDLPKDATSQQRADWNAANNSYESYLKKKELFDSLSQDVADTHKKLTDWVAENMVVKEEDILYELTMNALRELQVNYVEHGLENAYYGEVFQGLVRKATPAAMARAGARSPGRPPKGLGEGKRMPNPDSVAKRSIASAEAKAANSGLASVSKAVGKAGGVVLTLAFGALDIHSGKSPSRVVVETAAGFAAGAVIVVTAGAVAATAPAWIVAGAVIVGGAAIAYGVGQAYESWVPLRTRERIDEGLSDMWSATSEWGASTWKSVFG